MTVQSLQDYFGLEGKTAFVSGAARGIGEAIAETLAGCGATVIVSDRDGAGCDKVANAINAAGGKAFPLQMDIGDQMTIEQGFEKAAEILSGRLDILVNKDGMSSVLPWFEVRMQ